MLSVILSVTLVVLGTTASATHGESIHVENGQSIQAAIDSAPPGSCIIVGPGTYEEQLTISKSGIALRGNGVILKPPTTPTSNICSGLAGNDTEAGICVSGSDIVLADFVQEHRKVLSVGSYVEGVSITGFEIHGFTGLNIALVGAKDSMVYRNTLYDGGPYGFLTVGSLNTHAAGNTVMTTDAILFIGMCMDDVSPAEYRDNYVSGYLIAFCLQTEGSVVTGNTATNNCVGAFLDPGIKDITFTHNHISSINPGCPLSSPEFATGGIIVFGASDAKITGNVVENQKNKGTGFGLILSDSPPDSLASGNLIEHNIFRNNDIDIGIFTNATDNIFKQNECSTPAELCSA
ncbi:hypothetical protein, variant 2 [Verruconis gallopava]|uniref:Right handed beta helix domain-containing protein n=1 Tax=Verruconis gallopava TaxID=253628 RepID=A0A0D1YEF4_9PEZI|nr:uncharacterized protein PV09_09187 [Verruconis gallopava]XP_016208952.1 hypothetical protein, variant 1 [Verruconis gallopava]XP_016208953.1 hypothetical protein, variant 2 [Verruconis gallopava]KIV99081.1 hypothetical protein PV09_09187 [Verruconis gallopava]KIV99082.1 hypothetical protein, variant 1 [Verruconis gallopava]KIV99083.1 hypothetical protein, variant 2 [Verruconis gallopava]